MKTVEKVFPGVPVAPDSAEANDPVAKGILERRERQIAAAERGALISGYQVLDESGRVVPRRAKTIFEVAAELSLDDAAHPARDSGE